MTVKTGSRPNDFVLRDQKGNNVSLSDFSGKKILLSFHPLAWTEVCAEQMKSLEEKSTRFKEQNTVPLGISVDPRPSKAAWAEMLGLEETIILSDFWPHGAAARLMGVFRKDSGVSGRVNILLDEEGKVIWVKEYELAEVPDIDEVISVLEELC